MGTFPVFSLIYHSSALLCSSYSPNPNKSHSIAHWCKVFPPALSKWFNKWFLMENWVRIHVLWLALYWAMLLLSLILWLIYLVNFSSKSWFCEKEWKKEHRYFPQMIGLRALCFWVMFNPAAALPESLTQAFLYQIQLQWLKRESREDSSGWLSVPMG